MAASYFNEKKKKETKKTANPWSYLLLFYIHIKSRHSSLPLYSLTYVQGFLFTFEAFCIIFCRLLCLRISACTYDDSVSYERAPLFQGNLLSRLSFFGF